MFHSLQANLIKYSFPKWLDETCKDTGKPKAVCGKPKFHYTNFRAILR